MAIPERDTVYTNDGATKTTYRRESNATGWFVGIIVALALLAIAYLVFSANSRPATSVDVNTTPAITSPMTDTPATAPAPMTEGPATTTPSTPAPTDNTAPSTTTPVDGTMTPVTPAPATTP